MSKLRLIILSDLWGKHKNNWLHLYTDRLKDKFNYTYYDVSDLAGINSQDKSEVEIHQAFIEGGIAVAVVEILKLEKKNAVVLAFSIGGTIAWKAAMNGLNVSKIVAVSSTRLRKEHQKPKCEIELFFGDKDMNRPMDEWFDAMEIHPTILRNKTHEMYQEKSVAEYICNELTSNIYF